MAVVMPAHASRAACATWRASLRCARILQVRIALTGSVLINQLARRNPVSRRRCARLGLLHYSEPHSAIDTTRQARQPLRTRNTNTCGAPTMSPVSCAAVIVDTAAASVPHSPACAGMQNAPPHVAAEPRTLAVRIAGLEPCAAAAGDTRSRAPALARARHVWVHHADLLRLAQLLVGNAARRADAKPHEIPHPACCQPLHRTRVLAADTLSEASAARADARALLSDRCARGTRSQVINLSPLATRSAKTGSGGER